MVVAAVYILYLLFLIVRACSELRHMPYVGECHAGKHRAPGATPPEALGPRKPRDSSRRISSVERTL